MTRIFGRNRKRTAEQQKQEEEDATELRLGPEFQNEPCLLMPEVKILLEKLKQNNDQLPFAERHQIGP